MSERKPRRRWTRERSAPPVADEVDEQAPASGPARNVALEQAIVDDWDNDGAWAVYADWLLAQGDPHGELLGLELAIEVCTNRAKRGRLEQARRELCERNCRFFGEWFVPGERRIEIEPVTTLTMRRGFIEQAQLDGPATRPKQHKRMGLRQALATFLTCPSARLLRELDLYGVHWPTVNATLATLEPCTSLRSIWLMDDQGVVEPGPILGFAPELRALKVLLADLVIDSQWACPQLEVLDLLIVSSSSRLLERLGSASLTRLRKLDLFLSDEGDRDLAGIERLTLSTGLPALTHLRLSVVRPEFIAILARSPLMAQLRTLELSFHEVSRLRSIEQLFAEAEHLARVEQLVIQLRHRPSTLVAELTRALPNASVVPPPGLRQQT